MAFVLKRPTTGKGIVVFTHKELDFVGYPLRRATALEELIAAVRRRYFLGVHIGGFVPDYEACSFIDFYMAPDSTRFWDGGVRILNRPLLRRPAKVRHIPLVTRNFLDSTPPPITAKHFDIITVARESPIKNNLELFRCIKAIFDKGHRLRVLMVCRQADSDGDRQALASRYYEMFSAAERQLFTFMYLSSEMSLFPLPEETIRFLLATSRVFTLFSLFEGDSRMIHEALLAGLPVVVAARLRGGGRDFLDDNNAALFESFDDAPDVLVKTVARADQFREIRERALQRFGKTESLQRLKQAFADLFRDEHVPFDDDGFDTDNLSLDLAAHSREKADATRPTSDLTTEQEFREWLTKRLNEN
jgi:glycosyltransferase involved in cell wall biosynthesis